MNCCEDPMAMGRVVCPKPRRVGPSYLNTPISPLRIRMRSDDVDASDSVPGGELLDLILRKDYKAEQCAVLASSPPFFFGSPPCRAANPLVQDCCFGVETGTSKCFSPSDPALPLSAHPKVEIEKKQAAIRVEGFDCQSSRVAASSGSSERGSEPSVMSGPSDAPPSSTDGKLTNPVVVQPTVDHQNAKNTAIKESPPSFFVNSEPIREDQVENAVKFLSHPKVMGSPVMYRRSFLERKGLTKEEIDEAFRRVPDPTPGAATSQPVVSTQDGQINSSSNVQQQAPTQSTQPSQILPVGSISGTGTLSRFHWSYALFAAGFLAASGFGTIVLFKKTIVPRLKSWICKVVLEGEEDQMKKNDKKPSVAEEAAAAAKSAAAAAADASRAIQEIMVSKGEGNRCFEALINLLNVQVQEMQSMSTVIQKLELGQSSFNGRIAIEEQADHLVQTSLRQPYANGKIDSDSRSVRSLSPPPPKQPSVAPHPKSYMEILEMIQRGEKPSNIREINDAPPNPNQPLSNPRVAPKPKPWETNQAQNSSTSTLLTQQRISNSTVYDFSNPELNGASTVPWRQQNNVRITEVRDGDGQKVGSTAIEKGVRRLWVPPQPPPVVMPEAAAAIRQPKKPSSQKEQLNDDQLLARSLDVTNETKGTTVISESGNVVEANVEQSLSLNSYSSELRMGEGGSS
ncbi:hypothetical protein F511_00583 [Dorcoceras hygrometricum]|uniref:Peroxisomal membrane protein PEX14 n=1 Tax=Dorcoceras hygrometricum TaxID=472368 RepID=A0A2Z7BEC3_9LAMI|nr:hypothetical protein F511_00583 [Dorcoceras hygrometricum]